MINVALRKAMRLPEFLAWEERQELRYEFDGFQPVAMVGGTAAHNIINANVVGALHRRLRGTPGRVFGSDMKIAVASHIRYPDAIVVCSPVPRDAKVLRDPVVIFEVLSDSTALVDRIDKNEEYRQTPSVRHYVMLEQDRPAATVFTRSGDECWAG